MDQRGKAKSAARVSGSGEKNYEMLGAKPKVKK